MQTVPGGRSVAASDSWTLTALPASSHGGTIRLQINGPEVVPGRIFKIFLFDGRGALVRTLGPGVHLLSVKEPKPAAGSYVAVVRAAGFERTARVVILR